ncbi:MAG TPA: AI-2E family transporter [Tepidisphaeraceae bacterium]
MARSDVPMKVPKFVMLASLCITCAALYFARDVLIPLALAILLSFLLSPLIKRLEKRHVPRVAAVVLVVTIIFLLLGMLGWKVGSQLQDFVEQFPSYKQNIVTKIRAMRFSNTGGIGKAEKAIEEVKQAVAAPTTNPATQPLAAPVASSSINQQPMLVRVEPEPMAPLQSLSTYVGSVIGGIGSAGIVIVFVIFILLQREDLRDRIIRLIGQGRIHIATQALDDAATRISRYLTAQAIVNSTYGVAIAIGLLLIGYFVGGNIFPNFVLWALFCGLLRFVPYIGPWIAMAFPLSVAFAVYPGYAVFICVVAMFVIVELWTNNVMEPWLYGASTGMSPMAVIVAAVFWTWLWGLPGLLLSTPLTVCMVVIGKYVPQLAFLDILLGDEPVLEPHQRFYQRLLAMDHDEASEVAEEFLHKNSLEKVYDQMLLPALALAEQDRHAEQLDEARGLGIRRSIRDMIEELGDEAKLAQIRDAAAQTTRAAKDDSPADGEPPRRMLPKDCNIRVVCLPAHDEADEIAGLMLAQLLRIRFYKAFPISHNALASEMLEEVEKQQAQIIVISALPPAAVGHARYLLKRLSTRFANIKQIVGLWAARGDLSRAAHRINVGSDETIPLTSSLTDALEQIHRIAEPLLIAEPAAMASSSSPQLRP